MKEGEGMTDEKAGEEKAPEPIVLTATFSPDGRLNINCGLMGNPLMMFGFLEMIKQAVVKITDDAGESKIQKPGGIMNFVRGNKKRF